MVSPQEFAKGAIVNLNGARNGPVIGNPLNTAQIAVDQEKVNIITFAALTISAKSRLGKQKPRCI